MKAYLILEDGNVFVGEGFGITGDTVSEIVFNTSMSGYLEVLTDPSYAGQAVVMTYPLIANYGVCLEDCESARPWVSAYIVREMSRLPSNFRSEMSLREFLEKHKIPVLTGIDTRALTRILRDKGTMNGIITANADNITADGLKRCLNRLHAFVLSGVVKEVSCPTRDRADGRLKVALLDYGAKESITQKLAKRGIGVKSYNCDATADEILADKPDGILLSNGPGDPAECKQIIHEIKKLYDSDVPIFAICLGHQLMALATGATTGKLKYGHRGVNHPVKDLATGRVYITSQNHGYMVVADSVDPQIAEVSHVNVNDGTVEGLRYKNKKIFTIQFHPEASGGPQDTEYLFDKFIELMEGN